MSYNITKFKGLSIIQHLKLMWVIFWPNYLNRKLQIDTVLNPEETLDQVIIYKKNLVRYGDGEFNIMLRHRGIRFQDYDSNLSEELARPFQTDMDNIILAVPHGFVTTKPDKLEIKAFWWHYIAKNGVGFADFLRKNKPAEPFVFGDASLTRTVIEMRDKKRVRKIVEKIPEIWHERDVLIIEGVGTDFGIGNDLFDNAQTVTRIEAKSRNAYDDVDEIMETTTKFAKDKKNLVVIIALGPTASVLAYRLANKGIWAVDLGHFDLQYEYLRKGAFKRVKTKRRDNELGSLGLGKLKLENVLVDLSKEKIHDA
ncbi:GT-D fold domain-containing glycosyltransferase [Weissella confusa]|uniref:GT-D fold domain-containing glycosyltransferase n=1 Tax=Weissella confusa TaxID=1583 RepID=UPI00223B4A97|nr:GT-D fold domain-containing glycosyltransferase [Weissella confusa]